MLEALLRAEPTTLRGLEAIIGDLRADPDGSDWFGVLRPTYGTPKIEPPRGMSFAGVTFDIFREASPDPALADYRLVLPMRLRSATRTLERTLGPGTEAVENGYPAVAFAGARGTFYVRDGNGGALIAWAAPAEPPEPAAPLDPSIREAYLARLPIRLAAAQGATALKAVSAPPAGAGIARHTSRAQLRMGDAGLVTAHAPRIELAIDPPLPAMELARLWEIERPIAFSGDVHQQTWQMSWTTGRVVEGWAGSQNLVIKRLHHGDWAVRIWLTARPQGDWLERFAGPSPVYDLRECPAEIRSVEIDPRGTVTLRPVGDGDLDAFFEQQRDPQAVERGGTTPRDRADFDAHWAVVRADPRANLRAIEVDGRLAGHIVAFDREGRREVGYWLGREHWYMGVASRALARFLPSEPERPLYGYCLAANGASIRVLEQNGFVRAGEDATGVLLRLD